VVDGQVSGRAGHFRRKRERAEADHARVVDIPLLVAEAVAPCLGTARRNVERRRAAPFEVVVAALHHEIPETLGVARHDPFDARVVPLGHGGEGALVGAGGAPVAIAAPDVREVHAQHEAELALLARRELAQRAHEAGHAITRFRQPSRLRARQERAAQDREDANTRP
jgi:hypothetical protein